jgi:hypothetical protein
MKPLKLKNYGDAVANPIIVETFRTGEGWSKTGYKKRASVSWLRKLRREGIEEVSLDTSAGRFPHRNADFRIEEILRWNVSI